MEPRAEGELVTIPAGVVDLEGDLAVPPNATGVVLFAHGSGSSRMSPRNRRVARILREAGLGTLLMDLLSADEEAVDATTRHLRFDIPLLSRRLVAAVDWLGTQPSTADLWVGTFGSSTGAAAALYAAARRPERVKAVVSRGGRPDLARDVLPNVEAPVLLIVGARDEVVIDLNRAALDRLPGEKDLVLVWRATHLFEEPGALDEVADLAAEWFKRHLGTLDPVRTLT